MKNTLPTVELVPSWWRGTKEVTQRRTSAWGSMNLGRWPIREKSATVLPISTMIIVGKVHRDSSWSFLINWWR